MWSYYDAVSVNTCICDGEYMWSDEIKDEKMKLKRIQYCQKKSGSVEITFME